MEVSRMSGVIVLEKYDLVGTAARRAGVSSQTIRVWVDSGRLQSVRDPGGRRWILRASLDQLIARRAEHGKRSVAL
jgi:excisionase family DNA binding protein